jgi:ribonuclease HII
MIVGVDEAGRGPLAGIVTGCALYLKKNPPFLVKDSKALTHLQRQAVFHWLVDNSLYHVGIASPQEIDELNILQATFLAFERAISGLLEKASHLKKATFIIDGNLFRTRFTLRYRCIEKADETIKEVACASVIAKVTRDHCMSIADFLFPQWEFSRHKGYPTKAHFSSIEKHSLCPLHRRTFFPCNKIAGRQKYRYAPSNF